MEYVLYRITCKVNNKQYIGKSQEYEKRWRSHTNMLRNNEHSNYFLQQDWNAYGEDNFIFSIIKSFTDHDECMTKEMELVNSIESATLYNIVKDKSIGGDIFSHNPRKEEIREMRVNQMSGAGNHQYGKAKTQKMINSVKEANSKKINIEGVEYGSLTIASKELNIPITTVSYRLKANTETYKKWNYIS